MPGCFLAFGIVFSAGCASKEEAGVRGITEEVSEDAHGNLEMFRSEEELKIAQTGRLAGKLIEQGFISDAAELYPVAAFQRNIDYSYAYFHDYSCKAESEEGVCYPYELYHMSLSEEGDIVYYYTVLDYYSETAEDTGAKVIYAGNERDEVIREVTDLETALKIENPYSYKIRYDGSTAFEVGVDWFQVFENVWPQEKLEQLQDPVTAVETLYDLQGGEGEFSWVDGLIYKRAGTVTYRFPNGDEITYLVLGDRGNWRPFYCTEKDDELYPELKGITDYTRRAEQVYSVAEKNVTAQELKEASVWSDHNQNVDYYNDTDGVFLRHMSNGDISIYSCGGRDEKLILIGDNIYSAEIPVKPRYDGCIDLETADYDGDGQEEYAYRINTLGGTECYVEELYIFDPEDDRLNLRSFQDYEFPKEMLDEILPENCYLGWREAYELKEDQILYEYGVLYDKDGSRPGTAVGYLRGRIRYHADGSFEFDEGKFEMFEDLQGTETEEELLGH